MDQEARLCSKPPMIKYSMAPVARVPGEMVDQRMPILVSKEPSRL